MPGAFQKRCCQDYSPHSRGACLQVKNDIKGISLSKCTCQTTKNGLAGQGLNLACDATSWGSKSVVFSSAVLDYSRVEPHAPHAPSGKITTREVLSARSLSLTFASGSGLLWTVLFSSTHPVPLCARTERRCLAPCC